jgi:hypothetical protein
MVFTHHASRLTWIMTTYQTIIERLNGRFQQFPQVQAITLGGSLAANSQDAGSDIDLYVYVNDLVPLALREALVAEMGASRTSLNLQLWDLGDEWFDAASGIEIDVIYWWQEWIEAQLARVLDQQQGSVGYSTCFWHTIRHSQLLFDRDGWFAALQAKVNQPYPEALRRDILFKNHSVLRSIIPSYRYQLEKAVKRRDLVSVNHRLAGLLASYFDVLFALNRATHPGEKRLLSKAGQLALLPAHMAEGVTAVLQAPGDEVITAVDHLLDNLDDLLQTQGFDPATSRPR